MSTFKTRASYLPKNYKYIYSYMNKYSRKIMFQCKLNIYINLFYYCVLSLLYSLHNGLCYSVSARNVMWHNGVRIYIRIVHIMHYNVIWKNTPQCASKYTFIISNLFGIMHSSFILAKDNLVSVYVNFAHTHILLSCIFCR